MAIIKQYHKDTDTTYVYESISYWDEEKKQSRSKRRVIGKLDPETGEIIPTGKRGRKSKENTVSSDIPSELPQLYEQSQKKVKELTLEVDKKNHEIDGLLKEVERLKGIIERIDRQLAGCREICAGQVTRS